MNKNIWIINQYAGSPDYGMNYRSYYLGKELVNRGYNVTLFTASYTHQRRKLPTINHNFTVEDIGGIRYIWVKVPTYPSSKSLGRFWSMLIFFVRLFFYKSKKINYPKEIIISSLSIFPVLNAYVWSKKFKINFIFEVRDLWPQSLIDLAGVSKYHPLVLFMRWFENLGYKKAKYTVSLLPLAKNHMLQKGLKIDKFIYNPNGISLDEMDDIKFLNKASKNKLPKDKFIVGYTGAIGIANAIESFVYAGEYLKEYDDIRLVLVGDGKNKESIKKKAKQKGLRNIVFIDSIPKDEIQSMLQMFEVCFIGWHDKKIYEFGISANKLFDYMYSGKPILHAFSGNGDLVKMANCGLTVKAQNPTAIAEGIIKMYNLSKDRRDKLGENGRKYVLEYHTYKTITDSYENLFEHYKNIKK